MNDAFYKAFEDEYRGHSEEIIERLRFYAPFLEALATNFPGAVALDLGAGRGEWLTLVSEYGFDGQGIDLNQDMVAACQKQGHAVRQGEVMKELQKLPDNSIALVSAFHLVEHLDMDTLEKLISEAYRILVPGGMLIMETPNPENFSVGSFKFYMDPTHARPLHPLFLNFLTRHSGFAQTMIARLQEWQRLHQQKELGIFDVLWGSSADYAVIAQKTTGNISGLKLTALFNTEFGISSETLTQRYDQNLQSRLQAIEKLTQENKSLLIAMQNTPVMRFERLLLRMLHALRKMFS